MYRTEILQNETEIDALANLMRRENCRSLLEIGSKFGGSLWRLARAMPKGSRAVSVDLPNGTRAWNQSKFSLVACIKELQAEGYDAHLIWGDSADAKVIEQCRRLGPFDIVFIDGNHTFSWVNRDWDNYSPMARLVALHDIGWHRAHSWVGVRIDVPQFWNWLRGKYSYVEFRHDPIGVNNGIGVVWLNAAHQDVEVGQEIHPG